MQQQLLAVFPDDETWISLKADPLEPVVEQNPVGHREEEDGDREDNATRDRPADAVADTRAPAALKCVSHADREREDQEEEDGHVGGGRTASWSKHCNVFGEQLIDRIPERSDDSRESPQRSG